MAYCLIDETQSQLCLSILNISSSGIQCHVEFFADYIRLFFEARNLHGLTQLYSVSTSAYVIDYTGCFKKSFAMGVTKKFTLKGRQTIHFNLGCLHPVACVRSR
jgi:hypothetical protein